jgi:uncharacterized membrane protein YedE/YeeE
LQQALTIGILEGGYIMLDWNHFTPLQSLTGGLLLGLASAGLILLRGRILGVSGIVGGLLPPLQGDRVWRFAFLAGLAVAPWLYTLLMPASLVQIPRMDAGFVATVLAGLLVGFGTRLGSGCTSGHGICGLSRFSLRSLVATLTFMAAGVVTVYLARHVV